MGQTKNKMLYVKRRKRKGWPHPWPMTNPDAAFMYTPFWISAVNEVILQYLWGAITKMKNEFVYCEKFAASSLRTSHFGTVCDDFLCPRDRRYGGILFLSCLSFCHSIILSFCPPLWNLNFANNFWTVSARALIFHMNIPCDKTFPWVPLFCTLWPWP